MTFYSNTTKVANTRLRQSNWQKLYVKDKVCTYQHKKRKNVLLIMDMKTQRGFFKDKSKNKIISQYKKINWM